MKKVFLISLLSCVVIFFISCEHEEKITGTPSPLISLDDIRLMYKDAPLTLKAEDMMGASYVCGIVISDPSNGNSPDGLVIMQSYRRKQLRGIALALGDTQHQYNAGDSIVVKIEGSTLERVNGILQLSGIPESSVTKISTGNEQKVHITTGTFSAVSGKMNIYESTLVQLRQAFAQDIVLGQTFVGDVELNDGGTSIFMHTEATASFAAETVPGLGDYMGIVLSDNQGQTTLWLRNSNDYEGASLEPYEPKELYANFPEGWENPIGARKGAYTTGTMETYATGEWLMNRCYTLSSVNITSKTGIWAVMMQNAQVSVLEMNFNLPYGVSKLSFDYGAAVPNSDTNLPITMKVEYSQDSGNTWQQIEDLLVISNTTKHSKEYTLDIKGPVRFRFSKDNAPARAFIDQIAVYQN